MQQVQDASKDFKHFFVIKIMYHNKNKRNCLMPVISILSHKLSNKKFSNNNEISVSNIYYFLFIL